MQLTWSVIAFWTFLTDGEPTKKCVATIAAQASSFPYMCCRENFIASGSQSFSNLCWYKLYASSNGMYLFLVCKSTGWYSCGPAFTSVPDVHTQIGLWNDLCQFISPLLQHRIKNQGIGLLCSSRIVPMTWWLVVSGFVSIVMAKRDQHVVGEDRWHDLLKIHLCPGVRIMNNDTYSWARTWYWLSLDAFIVCLLSIYVT